MNCHSNVHWEKSGSKLIVNISLDKDCKIKGDLNNILGKCIRHVFDKPFEKGSHRISRNMKKVDKGAYTLKLSTDEGSNVIRFMID